VRVPHDGTAWREVVAEVATTTRDYTAVVEVSGYLMIDDVSLQEIPELTKVPTPPESYDVTPPDAAPPPPPTVKVEAGKNLLGNPGFEVVAEQELMTTKYLAATGWDFYAGSILDRSLVATKDAARTGEVGLRYGASKDRGLPSASTKLDVEPGRTYQLVFWAKAVGVSSTSKLFSSVQVGRTRIKGPHTTEAAKDWTRQTIDFTAGPTDTTVKVSFSASIDAAGHFMLDDVELVAVP
jgi:hypothetical protein